MLRKGADNMSKIHCWPPLVFPFPTFPYLHVQLHQWFPTFLFEGHLFFSWRVWGVTRLNFVYIPLKSQSPPLSLSSPPTARVSGSAISSPAGPGRSPSRQRILEYSRTKSDRLLHRSRAVFIWVTLLWILLSECWLGKCDINDLGNVQIHSDRYVYRGLNNEAAEVSGQTASGGGGGEQWRENDNRLWQLTSAVMNGKWS